MIGRLCIIGVGLIGGSIACAARKNCLCVEIVGFDKDEENLKAAKQMGVIDDYSHDLREATHAADFVMIAVPVGAVERLFVELKTCWSSTAVYTDSGSTKVNIVDAARAAFGTVPENFVPGHPIAGGEQSGVRAATPDLFTGRRVILTPLPATDSRAVQRASAFWSELGAKISTMDVAHHDQLLAATSHLPHVLAFALVDMLGLKDEKDEIFRFAAGGFRDFTRIASSDPVMWRDICRANRNEILRMIEQFQDELTTVGEMLKSDDSEQLLQMFVCANTARKRFLDQYNC